MIYLPSLIEKEFCQIIGTFQILCKLKAIYNLLLFYNKLHITRVLFVSAMQCSVSSWCQNNDLSILFAPASFLVPWKTSFQTKSRAKTNLWDFGLRAILRTCCSTRVRLSQPPVGSTRRLWWLWRRWFGWRWLWRRWLRRRWLQTRRRSKKN